MSRDHVEFLMKNIDPSSQPWDSYPAFVKKIWVPMTQLKAKQYQIVCVDGGFVDGSLEYTVSKFPLLKKKKENISHPITFLAQIVIATIGKQSPPLNENSLNAPLAY